MGKIKERNKDVILNALIIVFGILIIGEIVFFILFNVKIQKIQKEQEYLHTNIREICEEICEENICVIDKNDFIKELSQQNIKYDSIIFEENDDEYILGVEVEIYGEQVIETQCIEKIL